MHYLTKINLKLNATAILIAALIIGFTGCTKEGSINLGHVTLATSASLGHILVDGKGKTLYFYTKDVSGQSMCTGGCLTSWPVYYAGDIKPGTGIDATDFATITRSDGVKQTTYKGWPLYYFAGDPAAGSTKGDNSDGIWFAAKPTYSLMLANAQLVGLDGKNYLHTYVEGTEETQYLVDAKGRTLYTYSNDYVNGNTFTNTDATHNANWPIFYITADSLPSSLNKADFGTITVFGSSQLTYKGHPLYYFGQDTAPGQNKGVSAGSPGTWQIVNTQTNTPTVLLTNNATFGKMLTDSQGHTLYFFAKDTKGIATCTGSCTLTWPLFSPDQVVLPAGSSLSMSDFGTTGDGATKQVTYKGWPLYRYSPTKDGVLEAPGATSGDNVPTTGTGVWFVAKPDYSVMFASALLADGSVPPVTYTDVLNVYATGTTPTPRYFVDPYGRTLYLHVSDTKNTNKFTNTDAGHNANWPTFTVDINRFPTGMTASEFTIVPFNGVNQLVYRGYPLYYYGADGATRTGSNKGFAAGGIGTNWRIVNTDVVALP